jgi:AraC-like DNA-binding protein
MLTISQSRRYTLLEFNPPYLGTVTHLGKFDYPGAQPGLPPHVHHDVLEICYVHRGNLVFETGGETFRLRGGDVFLSFPDEVHSTGEFPVDKSLLYWIGVQIENRDRPLLDDRDSPDSRWFVDALRNLKLRVFRGSGSLRHNLDEAIRLLLSDHEMRTILVRNRISDFLVDVIEMARRESRDEPSPTVRRCIDWVDDHSDRRIRLEELADQCALSLPRFKQRFKDETGVPPGEFIVRRKVNRARSMLDQTDRSVTAIAMDLGFTSSQYFATVFRRYTNMSPSEYRRRSRPH